MIVATLCLVLFLLLNDPVSPEVARCVSTESAINSSLISEACAPALKSEYTMILPLDYTSLDVDLRFLDNAVMAANVGSFCDQAARGYLCNYIFIPCDSNTSEPIGICEEDCRFFFFERNSCNNVFSFLFGLSSESGVTIPRQCNDTLLLLEMTGSNVTRSTECLRFRESIGVVSSAPNQPQPIPSTSSSNSSPTASIEQSEPNLSLILSLTGMVAAILVCFGIAVGIIYRKKRSSKKEFQLPQFSETTPSNCYNTNGFNGFLSHEYDAPLFQLSREDVMDNAILKNAMIPFEWIYVEEEIGHGAFGSVLKGRILPKPEVNNHTINILVAIKTIKNSSASYSELKGFLEESTLMCEFNHPHVLGLIGISLDSNHSPYLLLPFMENGDLREFLKNKRGNSMSNITSYPQGLNCEVLTRICKEIAQGMEYLAAKKLVHRDLAARNCMVDENMSIKVADFGLTRDIYQTDYYRQNHRSRVPIKWMAPESLYDRISNEKTDVWSYGVTCWEVFSLGRAPYPTISNADMLTYLEHGHRLQKPYLCPEQLFSLIISCWRENPTDRPNFAKVCRILSASNSHTIFFSGLPTIKEEESLLDSVMSVMVNQGIHEANENGASDEYVDINPQLKAPTINELIKDIGNITPHLGKDRITNGINSTINTDISDCAKPLHGNIRVSQSMNSNPCDCGSDDNYIEMRPLNFHQIEVRDKRMSHSNHDESVLQTVIVSDYIHMEPA